MNKKIITLLLSGALAYAPSMMAQSKSGLFTIPIKNGSVFMSLSDKQLSKSYIAQHLPTLLGLSANHTFSQKNETTDELGFTHISYQQFFKGIKVDNGLVLVHLKNGVVNSINGRVAQFNAMNTSAVVEKQTAVTNAKTDLDVIKEIRQYPAELLIAGIGSAKNLSYALAYKVRIDGKTSKGEVVMMNVFVDAQSGKVLKKVTLIAHADVTGTAQTLYSGTKAIVMDDSIAGKYRLKDNARNIVTLDATGAEPDWGGSSNLYFTNAREITNNSTTWNAKPALMQMKMNTVSNSIGSNINPWFGDYLASTVVKTITGQPQQIKAWPDIRYDVYDATNLPTTTRNLYVFPDGDVTLKGSFGISDGNSFTLQPACYFTIDNITAGTYNWNAGNNNTGTYTIANTAHPGVDAHWGMERTHDFYMQKFNRNSYDGNGGKLINYVNGIWPTAGYQNNAAALPAPYFAMVYGLGDGIELNPLVSIDVMGHEFTHMVTELNGNGGLDYFDESGALNESFSDIMGAGIEFFAKGSDGDWLMGEEISVTPGDFMRSMSQPKTAPQYPQPDTYEGDFWDLSDPHFCSGVQNKWFYLLCQGGTGTNDKNDSYHVYPIGMDTALQITYRNLTHYLLPDATFMDAYNGSILAAKDLYSDSSQAYHTVRNAWYAVGIGDADTTKVTPPPPPPPPVVGLDELQLNGQHLKLYPNPASGILNITSDINQKLNAEIVNAVGAKVMAISIGKGNNVINISALAKGIYFVKYDAAGKEFTQKLVVQ